MIPHNHDLSPQMAAFIARRDNVPEDIRKRIREMKEDNTPAVHMWARVQQMYEERGEVAPSLILDDLLVLSRKSSANKGPALNDAQAAITELQDKALNDNSGDHPWVVRYR